MEAVEHVDVLIVGSGPAGLACAGDLAKAGVEVTVFEALHVAGGVLKYGIPDFRLPNETIDIEISALEKAGVSFQMNQVIGKVFTVPDLLEEMGYDAVFIGTGAGSPRYMGIPGEGLNGVVSANELLTRINLMQGFRFPRYDTPVGRGHRHALNLCGEDDVHQRRPHGSPRRGIPFGYEFSIGRIHDPEASRVIEKDVATDQIRKAHPRLRCRRCTSA